MGNYATQYLAKYMEKNDLSVKTISKKLEIPEKKLIPDTRESLTAEEFLALCQYLHIHPENILLQKF